MTVREATALIRDGVGHAAGETWGDFGAGAGTFTKALAGLVGEQGRIIAVDQDAGALRALYRLSTAVNAPRIEVLAGDVSDLSAMAGLQALELDGVLFGNVLHFVADPLAVLMHLRSYLRADGKVLVVEYDRRGASRWVPFPLPLERLADVARRAGYGEPVEVGRRRSRYQGELYCACLTV